VDPLAQLGELFAVDDGSLPEIRVEGLDPPAVNRALALIRGAAIQPPSYAHDQGLNAPRAADHFVAALEIDGCRLPALGFGPFHDALILDYRMGPEWSPDRVGALFELLHRICRLHQGAYVEIEPEANPNLRRAFQKAWMQYLTQKGAA
jgi:hypothetical protein